MAATTSYLIPAGDLSLDERRSMRQNADAKLLSAATKLKIRDNPDDLCIRDVLPFTDFALAPAANNEEWLMAGPGVNGTDLQYFASQLAVERCVVFFGLWLGSVPYGVTRVRLTQGATSAQIRSAYQVEKLEPRLEPFGYFNEGVIFIRQEVVRIMVMPKAAFAANTLRLGFEARTIEPIGLVISGPSI